jgi:hypothetical protein
VHTSKAALAQGEAEIQRIGAELRREKRAYLISNGESHEA